jgi:hypothetical protein
MVLPEGDAPHPGELLDTIMLANPGGQERTKAECASLLAKAGFNLEPGRRDRIRRQRGRGSAGVIAALPHATLLGNER